MSLLLWRVQLDFQSWETMALLYSPLFTIPSVLISYAVFWKWFLIVSITAPVDPKPSSVSPEEEGSANGVY